MKKNTFMRLAMALVLLVLVTTSAVGGTFAKYVSEGSYTDKARVAKWGVTVTANAGDLFTSEYDADSTLNDAFGTAIAKSVVSSNGDALVAPGTSGSLGVMVVEGTPEVAVEIKKVATLTLTGWIVDGTYYCPIIITVNGTDYDGLEYASADDFKDAVEEALTNTNNYQAKTEFNFTDTISWKWNFSNQVSGANVKQTDVKDTALGNLADAPTIELVYTVTVTQID